MAFVVLSISSFFLTDPQKSVTVQDQYHQKNFYSTCNTETSNNHTTRLVFAKKLSTIDIMIILGISGWTPQFPLPSTIELKLKV